eukprot:CCRYP_010818-RA/>CCRYP_010818-RA protein AED:0.27 eAED:0.76 QI:0/0/0/1/0/0/2/0/161
MRRRVLRPNFDDPVEGLNRRQIKTSSTTSRIDIVTSTSLISIKSRASTKASIPPSRSSFTFANKRTVRIRQRRTASTSRGHHGHHGTSTPSNAVPSPMPGRNGIASLVKPDLAGLEAHWTRHAARTRIPDGPSLDNLAFAAVQKNETVEETHQNEHKRTKR